MVDRHSMRPTVDFAGLASDSREVKPGYLFAALAGSQSDGANFIADAVRRGARAVLGRPELAARARDLGVRFLADENPRLRLAHLAAEFFAGQPSTVAAITGTNGKTSVAVFLRQIWEATGKRAASLGTIGLVGPTGATELKQTTPDPIELHRLLAQLAGDDVQFLALEASSHGLDQYRLDGVDVAAAAFTNITRDHLDYHPTFDDYMAAKLRLFLDIVRAEGVAVVNVDSPQSAAFVAVAESRGLKLLTVGQRGEALRLIDRRLSADGQSLEIGFAGKTRHVSLPLVGDFQASNALLAAGLAIGLGDASDAVFGALETLRGAPGRLEKVAYGPGGAPIYVDYAHTPDALVTVLNALRPHVTGQLHVLFGCGGDRDKGKRPLMGAAAAKYADIVIVTDDNPRHEDAGAIRRQALAGCPGASEIADRADAIKAAIAALKTSDALVIAGKGHEAYQIIGSEVRPFSDRECALQAALALGGAPGGRLS